MICGVCSCWFTMTRVPASVLSIGSLPVSSRICLLGLQAFDQFVELAHLTVVPAFLKE